MIKYVPSWYSHLGAGMMVAGTDVTTELSDFVWALGVPQGTIAVELFVELTIELVLIDVSAPELQRLLETAGLDISSTLWFKLLLFMELFNLTKLFSILVLTEKEKKAIYTNSFKYLF